MINTPLSAQVECLTTAKIHHSMFIHDLKCEIHLWAVDRFKDTLELLESHGVRVDSVVKIEDFYLIRF